MTSEELQRENKILRYELDFVTVRLNKIRACKEELIRLLDTPTPQEIIEAGDELPIMKGWSGDGRH